MVHIETGLPEISQIPQPERKKITAEELLNTAKETLQRGEKIVCANDVDLTVSTGGVGGEDDPRKTAFHPGSGKALADIEKYGQQVGFISNRGGRDVARMAIAAGLKHPTIIGTFGFETFQADANNPDIGEATIDDRFEPYNDPISRILRRMHGVALDFAGQKYSESHFQNNEIPTRWGPIILEVKGRSHVFPFGFAEGFIGNLLEPQARAEFVAAMKETYPDAVKSAIRQHMLATMAIQKTWGMEFDPWDPKESGRYSISFVPKIKQGKAYGMTHLLRGIREKMPDTDRIGLVWFGGDGNADAEAMRAGSMAAKIHNRDLFEFPVESRGIWVKPQVDQPAVRKQADLIVDGPDGYAQLLSALSDTIKRYS